MGDIIVNKEYLINELSNLKGFLDDGDLWRAGNILHNIYVWVELHDEIRKVGSNE